MKIIMFVLFLLFSNLVYSQDMNTVTNLSVQQGKISRQDAKLVYTLKKRFWDDGLKITVFRLPLNDKIHIQFVKEVLGINPQTYVRETESQINAGFAANIKEVPSLNQMVNKVAITTGAIGYLNKDYLLVYGEGNVQVLRIVD